jgi:DNA-binding Lrp family transcriptional regulator
MSINNVIRIEMDNLDQQIVMQLQMDFPLEANPYDIIAERLGIEPQALFKRVEGLIDLGTIRRIGASIDSRKIGYHSTLAAVRVSDEQVDRACQLIDSCPEITHSYLRNNEYNVWFTVIASGKERVGEVLEELRIKLGLEACDVLDLPMLQLFKLDARFKPTK